MLKAIIFDLGGVLVDLDFEGCLEYFRNELGYEDIVKLLDRSNQRGVYGLMEEGMISADDFRAEILKGARPGTTPEDVDRAVWSLLVKMDPYKVDLLNELSQRYDLYILSNNNAISMAKSKRMFRDLGLDEDKVFKDQFLSYQLKLLKPSKEIYMEVIRRIGCLPEEALFIDDSMGNIKGAQSVGIRTLFYNQGDDLRAALYSVLEKEDASC